jgi:deazaflavin-dependent oxidoreductase (nitroreductase family)
MSTFRPTRSLRFANRIVMWLVRRGIPMGRMAILEVVGRKSGLVRATPVAVDTSTHPWHLAAPYGPVDWVRNLRAAGGGVLVSRGRRIPVTARELPPAEAAPILRRTMADLRGPAKRALAPHFSTRPDEPLEAWVLEAARHPMFRLEPAPSSARSPVVPG